MAASEKERAVIEAARAMTLSSLGFAILPTTFEAVVNAVRALDEPEPRYRVDGYLVKEGGNNVLFCYLRSGDKDPALAARIAALLNASEKP